MSDDGGESIVLKAGSRGKLVTLIQTHVARGPVDPEGVTLRLWRTGLDSGREQVASWPAPHAMSRPGDWADEVLDLVRMRTEIAGARCEYAVEVTDESAEVLRSYPIVAQPATQNLSPTPEGLVHLAMRHSSALQVTMLQDRAAVIESYQAVIATQRSEIDRLVAVVASYQAREDAARDRELRLLDRERELLTREASSEITARERHDERVDRVVDKIADHVGEVAVRATQTAIERMPAADAAGLVREFAPLIKTLME